MFSTIESAGSIGLELYGLGTDVGSAGISVCVITSAGAWYGCSDMSPFVFRWGLVGQSQVSQGQTDATHRGLPTNRLRSSISQEGDVLGI